MNTKMYVGNLPFDVTEDEIREHFESQGSVTELNMIMDRETGRPRGFAFVTMGDATSMENAVRELDGVELKGRPLKVNEAKPRENRSFNNDGGGGGRNNNNNNYSKGSRKGNRGQDRW